MPENNPFQPSSWHLQKAFHSLLMSVAISFRLQDPDKIYTLLNIL